MMGRRPEPDNLSIPSRRGPTAADCASARRAGLYTIDTVARGRMDNSLALGDVDDVQLDELASRIDANADGRPCFRLLVTHHPIRYPPKVPAYTMVVKNAAHVAQRLAGATPQGVTPVVHLVMSGHTHALDPRLWALPPGTVACAHAPLGNDQAQLVVASALQRDPRRRRNPHPQQVEVLRLYAHNAAARKVVVRRLVGARLAQDGRVGRYHILIDSTGSNGQDLEVTL